MIDESKKSIFFNFALCTRGAERGGASLFQLLPLLLPLLYLARGEGGRRGTDSGSRRRSVPQSACAWSSRAGRLEPWYSYTHWFPMASSHVLKPGQGPGLGPGLEQVPKMQPAMMMFSSKYWARRGMSLDSAMFQQQQQRHTGGQMVRTTHPPLKERTKKGLNSKKSIFCLLNLFSLCTFLDVSRKKNICILSSFD